MRRTCSTAGFCFAVAVACSAGGVLQTSQPPNILLVTIDTLRADRVGCYGYTDAHTPSLDSLASRGIRFDQATAHAPLTVPSHVSIMTGLYPSGHGARDNGSYVLNPGTATIASILRGHGFRTAAFVGSFLLASQFGFDRGFAHYDDELRTTGPLLDFDLRRPADVVASHAAAWLRDNAAGPFFAWIHFYDPHSPYPVAPQFRSIPQPYDGAIATADAGLASILETLDALQLTHRTIIIVTADHGEGLGDHGEREHGLLLYDSVIRVPLIIDVPGAAPRVIRRQVRHVDLMPTILELAGVPVPVGLPGRSLLPFVRRGDTAAAAEGDPVSYAETWYGQLHFGWSEMRSVRVDGWKFIVAPHPKLFDLRHDPKEMTNLVGRRTELADRLNVEARSLGRVDAAVGVSRPPDAATAERLRGLGYLSGGATELALASPGADPADMVSAFEKYNQGLNAGIQALRAEHPETAVSRLRVLTAAYPGSFEAHHYLGYAYAAAGKNREAIAEYDKALAIAPDYAVTRFNLAKAASALGQHTRAAAELQKGFALEPRSFYGWMIAGVVAWNASDDSAAVAAFKKAVGINPIEPRAHANLAEAYMRAGDLADARSAFQSLIQLKYQPAASHFNLGVIAEKLGDVQQARVEYREALSIDPTLEPARRALDALR